jgi:hypothetical protein
LNRKLIVSLGLFAMATFSLSANAQTTAPATLPESPSNMQTTSPAANSNGSSLPPIQDFPNSSSVVADESSSPAAGQDPAASPSTSPSGNSTATSPAADSPKPKVDANDPTAQQQPQQTKRILGIIPNYRAVSADTHLPPLSVGKKFWLGTQDTFDYSNFIFVGMIAGVAMAGTSEPAFGQGAAGYGRYYWHTFVDVGIGNYMTEAIVPVLTREDPRYYTLGKGGFFKRTGYAVSRLFITRTDAGHPTFNFSEIVGNGAAAGISNAYYPNNVNTFVKTYQRWGTEIAFDGIGNILKEFWPEINHSIFHEKY